MASKPGKDEETTFSQDIATMNQVMDQKGIKVKFGNKHEQMKVSPSLTETDWQATTGKSQNLI